MNYYTRKNNSFRKYNANTYVSKNGLTPTENRNIGSLSYFLINSLLLLIFIHFWGFQAYEQPWPYVLHLLSFWLVKKVLIKTKIWIY